MSTPVRVAKGLILQYMRICGFDGFASYWGVIYVRQGFQQDQALLRHEQQHLIQMQRDGKLWFTIKYLYWLCLYGYYNNPYEVEAREIAAR